MTRVINFGSMTIHSSHGGENDLKPKGIKLVYLH